MFKLLALTTTALVAASAASAQTTTDAPSWTGPYVGIQGGYGFDAGQKIGVSGTSAANSTAIANGTRSGSLNQNRSGVFGGGTLGYNLQRGSLLVGAEGDFSYFDRQGHSEYYGTDLRRTYAQSHLNWLGTGRARVGYVLPDGSGLFYGTGGYAFGRVQGRAEFDAVDGTPAYAGGHKYTADGWTAGVGAEFRPFAHQVGPMSRVSFKLESNYYDLGRSHIQAGALGGRQGGYTLAVDTRGYNARFGINYAF